ncbi:MAG: hypothetical protein M0008_07905 [Actinomycetota bacterium]|nr:hypothetical protein [Actinomycetota bacterium]
MSQLSGNQSAPSPPKLTAPTSPGTFEALACPQDVMVATSVMPFGGDVSPAPKVTASVPSGATATFLTVPLLTARFQVREEEPFFDRRNATVAPSVSRGTTQIPPLGSRETASTDETRAGSARGT